ncbi:MAG TPA: MDR family MFS transporter [Acidimicrobiales bacterium]|nr:MDR family MFS transporter [Acidimicrobiales bacterium]
MSVSAPEAGDRAAGTPPQLSKAQIRLVMVGLLLGLLLASLDQTIVATALPTIASDLHGLSHLTWVVTAYLLASTASTPLWGKLGDQYGRKIFFQAAIAIFLVGSVLSGLSRDMIELIFFRAIQGLGAGGLIVGAMASVGDVVSPRERGRYQGVFGSVFAVSSILGPLIGGFFVDKLSWHWIFYVNIPIGVVALVVTSAVLPASGVRVHHVIDYLGTTLLALAATALILLTSLGGNTYRWLSAPIIIMGGASVVLVVAFLRVERRASEPIIPLPLMANRTFSSTSAIGFVVGFAMFGAITFLPLYMQVVKGLSPTISGLRLTPLMGGLLITSVSSGQIISRWGRYKVFPVVGSAVMTVGLFLLSRIDPTTGWLELSLGMLVLGLGIGMILPVLVIAVQNAVEYKDLGTATSGTTFFRSIGASFGVAIFGAIFSNTLLGNVRHSLGSVRLPPGLSVTGGVSPTQLKALDPAVRHVLVTGYSHSLQSVFLAAVPVALLAFALTWLLPEVALRRTTEATDPADTLAPTSIPHTSSSRDEIARALSVLARRENREQIYRWLATEAALTVSPAACWLLLRVDGHDRQTALQLADHLHVPVAAVTRLGGELEREGLIDLRPIAAAADRLTLTLSGRSALDRLAAARRRGLEELLGGWSPEEHAEVVQMVARLASDLMSNALADPAMVAPPAAPD